ncbi:hypothetical protein Kpol_1031p16 [Vanderwaltozyma polyspora DSM 70294]|uniref:Biogenesis of lysosome-related organelles complex 1 subunit CNL1 n=1 Tax=Vanderwaltozyma polyspora (strain ATCC 22028 / DSM 70294 / BCRC 21397 / CBS 2163 / NBRC 10782 / NRRL Y-8283 / UCD 57-17) TaxID=436907 RepID=BL1S4_VANPO|nr:uncharacterized protein Kpol_1031p16 [Vanderwaltozyma polyspora DSM 70294]A7THV0.1 RecName: Full=Biogenesis of lysosome-related organelles complex 1 subunit CNL1; Short=BLOC-1 subunit CNL1; AltName: Full=CNO-like protein 1 [Vanderwaltozyma polyspora DSM 70294]EDO18112.1 hypothetical protein Kpol_1031p16 [Vanderwaltozyma polyspora DSM 70294]
MSSSKGDEEINSNNEEMLGIDKLSVDYDYLLYKINDYVNSIQIQTKEVCQRQNELISQNVVEDIVDVNIQSFKDILSKCEELENYFTMLDQIEMISDTFHGRIDDVLKEYRKLNGN